MVRVVFNCGTGILAAAFGFGKRGVSRADLHDREHKFISFAHVRFGELL
jgi:hypothetical protein